MGRQAALSALLVMVGCNAAPFGEVLIAVDSEASVPAFVGRLRVDLYAADGTWYQSRDVPTPSLDDWPLSFGVYSDEPGDKLVRVRLRGYPEGGVRDYQGERFAPPPPFSEPPSVHSIAELCGNVPQLAAGDVISLRRAAQPFTELLAQGDCAPPTRAGSAAVKVVIPQAATYRFEVIGGEPDGAAGQLSGDTTLFLRTECVAPGSQVACNDDIDTAARNYRSRIVTALNPGTYYLITGGKYGSPADVTLRWTRDDRWLPVLTPDGGASPDGGAAPALPQLSGAVTPLTEPQPQLAIDRLLDVRVRFGTRSTAKVLLRGECLGTQADLAGGATCTGTAGVRVPVVEAPLEDGIDRGARSQAGSWAAEQPAACTVAPRTRSSAPDGTPLFDEEVCVPGGAFTLGSMRVIGLGVIDAVPEQVAVVDPFLLDAHEFTVARYRRAVAAGFVPPDRTPLANPGIIVVTAEDTGDDPAACTFSAQPMGRERQPLNCVSWYTARALCRFLGGDLPSHVEWEYAATAAGRGGAKTLYPWGDDEPDCCRTAFARGQLSNECAPQRPGQMCARGYGPIAVDAEPWQSADVSAAGVSAMGGSMGEWALDSLRDGYRDPCWMQHMLRGIGCDEREALHRSARGGAWGAQIVDLRSASLFGYDPGLAGFETGFRCARRGRP